MNSTSQEDAPAAAAAGPARRQVLAVLLLALFVYLPSVGNEFPMDDQPLAESVQRELGPNVVDPVVGEWHSPLFYFSHHYWYPHQPKGALYRPVTVWSFALTFNLVGRLLPRESEAFPHHLINVLLHVWATWLVLLLVLTLGMPNRAALLTAALFGLHAIHSEVVAGIVGRAELFGFCFGAQAMLLFVRGGTRSCVGAGALLFLAACSKESAVAWFAFLPCYLLAHAWMRDRRLGPWSVLGPDRTRLLLVLGVPLLAWVLVRWSVVGGADPQPAFSMNELAFLPDSTRILTAIKVWGHGLYLCMLPFNLVCIYSAVVFEKVNTLLDPGFLAAALALLLFLFLGLRYARRAPLLFLAMAWFLGFSFLTSNIPLAIGTVFGERLYYTPSLGICLLPALFLPLLRPQLQQMLMLMLLLWTALCCAVILQRNFVWKNDATLFKNDVKVQPKSIDLHRKAADVYMSGEKRDLDEARRLLMKAVQLDTNYPLAYLDLGDINLQQGEWKEAIKEYQFVLKSRYLGPSGAEPFAHAGIGNAWLGLLKPDEAMQAFQRSLGAESRNHIAWTGIGRVHAMRNEIPEAAEAFLKAIGFAPRHRQAWLELTRYGGETLPPGQVFELSRRALVDLFPGDPEMFIYVGGMGYKAGLRPSYVASVLRWGIDNLPPDQRSAPNTFTARFYLAHTLEQVDRAAAIGLYSEIVNHPSCPKQEQVEAQKRLRALQSRR